MNLLCTEKKIELTQKKLACAYWVVYGIQNVIFILYSNVCNSEMK